MKKRQPDWIRYIKALLDSEDYHSNEDSRRFLDTCIAKLCKGTLSDKQMSALRAKINMILGKDLTEDIIFDRQRRSKLRETIRDLAQQEGVTNSDIGVTKCVTNSDIGVTKCVTNSDIGVTKCVTNSAESLQSSDELVTDSLQSSDELVTKSLQTEQITHIEQADISLKLSFAEQSKAAEEASPVKISPLGESPMKAFREQVALVSPSTPNEASKNEVPAKIITGMPTFRASTFGISIWADGYIEISDGSTAYKGHLTTFATFEQKYYKLGKDFSEWIRTTQDIGCIPIEQLRLYSLTTPTYRQGKQELELITGFVYKSKQNSTTEFAYQVPDFAAAIEYMRNQPKKLVLFNGTRREEFMIYPNQKPSPERPTYKFTIKTAR